MFDISGTGPSTPMYAEDLYGAGQNIIADQMAPGIKRMTGYESPKRKAMAIADTADLSSMKSIQDTYKKLQQINAGAASAWLKEALDTYNTGTQRMTAETSRLQALAKAPVKRETKFDGVTGQLKYVDTGQPVPGFEDKKTPKGGDKVTVKSPTVQDITMIKEDIESEYATGLFDKLVDNKLPTGMTKDSLADFIFRYKQINPQETTFTVMEKIDKGTIDATKIISIMGASTAAPAAASQDPFSMPAIPK